MGDAGTALTVVSEGIDLAYREHVGEHIAEPLRPQEVQLLQRRVVVVQQHTYSYNTSSHTHSPIDKSTREHSYWSQQTRILHLVTLSTIGL